MYYLTYDIAMYRLCNFSDICNMPALFLKMNNESQVLVSLNKPPLREIFLKLFDRGLPFSTYAPREGGRSSHTFEFSIAYNMY